MPDFPLKCFISEPINYLHIIKFFRRILLLLFVLPSLVLQAQYPSPAIHIDKLPFQKPVNSILKDHDGFLWIGTDEGLYRYDGVVFDLINSIPYQGLHLSHPIVTTLLEDLAGNLWIGTRNGVNVYNASRNTIYSFLEFKNDSHVPNNDIISLARVGKEVWISNRHGSLYRVAVASQETLAKGDTGEIDYWEHVVNGERGLRNIVTHEGKRTWAISGDSTLLLLDGEGTLIKKVKYDFPIQSLMFDQHHDQVLFTHKDSLFATSPGLEHLQFKRTIYDNEKSPVRLSRSNFALADSHHVWLYGNLSFDFKENYLMYYNIAENRLTSFVGTLAQTANNEPSYITCAYPDEAGNLWLGFSNGLSYVSFKNQNFQPLPIPRQIVADNPSFRVRKILPLPDEKILIGSYQGLYLLDKKAQSYDKIDFWHSLEKRWVNPLAYDMIRKGDTVFMATEGNGLLYYHIKTKELTPHISKENYRQYNHRMRSSQWAISIIKDQTETLWLGTYGGMFQVHSNGTLSPLTIDGQDFTYRKKIFDILEDAQHRLWLGTATGLYSISENRDQYQLHPVSRINQLAITTVVADENHLWVGTWGEGFKFFDPVTRQVRTYTTKEGLVNNFVHAIFKGNDRKLWISTENGLSQFDLQGNTFRNFYVSDGIPGNIFNHKALGYEENGTLYLGGKNGVVAFEPEKIGESIQDNEVKISRIEQHFGKENRLQSYVFNAHLQKSIDLDYRDKFLSVYFSTNDLLNKHQNLTYLLEGFHDDWQFLGKKNNIQFASLPPGHYHLKVKNLAGNGMKEGQPLSIPVNVATAPYATWWAYLLYFLTTVCILFFILRMYFNRLKAQRQWQLEHEHTVKLMELDQARTRFFSNLAHELRTPLTLIKGPVSILQQQTSDLKSKHMIDQVFHHADTMLHLVDQMLELGRIEAGEEKVTFVHADIIGLLATSVNAFRPLAQQREIHLSFSAENTAFYMDFDPDKLRKVVYNLLSNACKFTSQGGKIACAINTQPPINDKVNITIADTGMGITPEDLPHIFDRFFQTDDAVTRVHGGSGIGLSYVKELIAMHGGTVQAESQSGKGTTFQIYLPKEQVGTQKERVVNVEGDAHPFIQMPLKTEADRSELPVSSNGADRPLVLVIEDHPEVANFIKECLDKYEIICAYDGEAGMQQAVHHVPDLIITDLMLPKIDGITLAHQLKSHHLTRHIPLIMLTAKATHQERLEGFKGGADAYLTKPFDLQELQLRVRNLLHLRDEISERFRLNSKKLSVPAEDPFVQDIIRVIEHQLDNPALDVQTLVKETATSRTQLHRKLKATTGYSAAQLIRITRLEKAKMLLLQNGQTVAQIAYQVGFSTPSHFTQSYRKYFGHLPSETNH